ncbi:putative protein isoform X1 [Capsicum annuum]
MRATLLWAVSDFPALAMLSGWSTKGKLACPTCNYDTCSQYLKYSRKMCYLGHRRFLPPDHPFRKDKKSFDGNEEHRSAPTPLSGSVKEKIHFFELSYWPHNKIRNNVDPIHIENNICDGFLGKLLEIDGKSKDHVNSRYDLQEMGIQKELQPKEDDTGCVSVAESSFFIKSKQKKLFCSVMKNAKLPKGCASNISDRVHMNEIKISGFKSHDAHIILHYLLQVAVRKVLPKNISLSLIRLVNEIKLGGPTHCRSMYPIERKFCKLKAFVRNQSCPETSITITEGFLAEECLTFCSRYLYDGVKTRFSRYESEDQAEDDESIQNMSPIFPKIGHPIGREKKKDFTFLMDSQLRYEAHRMSYSTLEMSKEHKNLMSNDTRLSAWSRSRSHSQEFSNWFEEKVKNAELPDYLLRLAKGPNWVAKRYTLYWVNGYRFHTKARHAPCKTQNSGVTLSATTDSFASARDRNPIDGEVSYYGVIHDITKIDYYGCFSAVLFRCDWFHNKVNDYGLTPVYFNRLCSTDDLFVLASQVHQVFYVEDPVEKGVYYSRNKVPIDLYDLVEENSPNIGETFLREPNDEIGSSSRLYNEGIRCSREDVPINVVYMPSNEQVLQDNTIEILDGRMRLMILIGIG